MQTRLVALEIVITLTYTCAFGYSGGTGEPNDPYQIATAEDLIALGQEPNDYNDYFVLTADIDLDPNLPGGRVFDRAVISPADVLDEYPTFTGMKFSGRFNGQGHTIRNLHIQGHDYLGLFGYLEREAVVTNLGLEDGDSIRRKSQA